MSGINKVILVGRLSSDVELKTLPNGSQVSNFTVATSESWVDKNTNEKKEKAEFSRIVVWGKLAELCSKYLAKGREVYVEGKMETRSYENKDGVKMYTTEINAKTVQFLGGSNSETKQAPAKDSTPTIDANTLPF